MKKGTINEIHTTQEAIELLKELYIKITIQRNLLINKEQNIGNTTKYKNLTREILEKMLNNEEEKNDKKTIQFLKNIIEEMLESETNQELKQKLQDIFGTYYDNLLNEIEKLKEPQKSEEEVLKLIKNSKVKIHEDKSPKNDSRYGDFIEKKGQIPEILYNDKNMMLIRLNKYITSKIQREKEESKKVVGTLEKEEVSKYEYQIRYEPNKIATIEYFGETNLGNKIKKGRIEYIAPMLAAIEKAKSDKREYIGKIYKICEELGTYVTQYDDNLEQRIQELKAREEREEINKSTSYKLTGKEENKEK